MVLRQSAVTSNSAETVGTRCYTKKGNRAPKLLYLLLQGEDKKYFLLCLTLPHYFLLEKKSCPVRPCPLSLQPAIVSILLARQGYFHPTQSTYLATFSALLQHLLPSWNFFVTYCHAVRVTPLLLEGTYEAW